MGVQLATIQIEQSLANMISAEALARGISIDEYLRGLISNGDNQLREGQMSLSEIDQVLDELSAGTDHIPALPPTFSREDIYFDHD
jgi:hypothetical protein